MKSRASRRRYTAFATLWVMVVVCFAVPIESAMACCSDHGPANLINGERSLVVKAARPRASLPSCCERAVRDGALHGSSALASNPRDCVASDVSSSDGQTYPDPCDCSFRCCIDEPAIVSAQGSETRVESLFVIDWLDSQLALDVTVLGMTSLGSHPPSVLAQQRCAELCRWLK